MNNSEKQGGGPGLWERFLCLFFPARCLGCGKVLPPDRLFCPACEKHVPTEPFRRRCNLPGAGARGFLIIAPMPYAGGFRHTLYGFKFRGQKSLAKPIGRLMASAARQTGPAFDGIAWVPMTKRKKRERGYNQSELLAKSAAKALGLPCLPLLRKVRETGVQHELSEKRRIENVKGAYRAEGDLKGKSLLLVDDIVTTGATLKECAKTLYAAGALCVTGLCAADVSASGASEG